MRTSGKKWKEEMQEDNAYSNKRQGHFWNERKTCRQLNEEKEVNMIREKI